MKMVTHRYTVWVDVPAVSGDGWSKYPDYSADEIGRLLRRAIQANAENFRFDVNHMGTHDASDKD